jgi:quinol monooxygenase YgiN
MIVLVATYRVKPGNADAVIEALERMAPLVREHEPGCLMYAVHHSREDSNVFLLYEQYADEAALKAHSETPYFKEIILDTVVPMLEVRERAFYDLVIG